MKRRKVLAMLMTAVMTFTSVAPETALVALAEGEDAVEEDVVVEELPFDLKGMPEGYELSEEQLEMKAAMKENDVLGTFEGLTEGLDYEAGTLMYLADTEEEAQTVAEAYNSELVRFEHGVAVIKLPETITMAQALTVAQDPAYLMPVVAPNYINTLIGVEDESGYAFDPEAYAEIQAATEAHASSWEAWVQGKNGAAPLLAKPDTYLQNPASAQYQWMHDMIGTYDAWSGSMGSDTISVAVIDSGVPTNHPDLAGRVTQIKVGDINPTAYTSTHGTHVAGIIGATAGNGIGIAGVAPKVNIVAFNVFQYFEVGSQKFMGADDADWVIALNICKEKKIPVANMSLGGPGYNAPAETAIKQAAAAGVNVFVAMGNENSNIKAFPANYEGAIRVASINPKGERSGFSNFGKNADIAAPGTMIMSCLNPSADDYDDHESDSSGNYGLMSGTSMACPCAAGVAALYMSKFGVQKPADMVKIMQKNATKAGSGQIGKIVNVGKMFASGAKAKAKSTDNNSFTFDIEGADEGAYVVYTTDGTDPVLVDGEVVNGQIFDGAVEFDASKDVVVVKSLVVTAAGEIGDVEISSITVSAKNNDEEIVSAKATVAVTGDNSRVADNKAFIYTVNVPGTAYDDTVLTLSAPSSVSWSVDKKSAKVVEVVTAEGTSTVIKALKTGKATVTAKGADGSTAKIKIQVIVPASSISITPDGNPGLDYAGPIAVGKSRKVGLVLGNTYGKPSISKVDWDWSIAGDASLTKAAKDSKAVKISASGKISVNKSKWAKSVGNDAYLLVTAKTTDGTNLAAVAVFQVWSPATICKSALYNPNTNMISEFGVKNVKVGNWSNAGNRYNYYCLCLVTDKLIITPDEYIDSNNILINSSNPDFAGAEFYGARRTTVDGKTCYAYIYEVVAGRKSSGKAKITLTLNDGSKKKVSVTFSK